MVKHSPYGTWTSPITSATVARAGLSLQTLWLDGEDLYWIEGRPVEGGRCVLVRRGPDGLIGDVTPPGFSVRTRVHEYGGAPCMVKAGTVFFSNDNDQRLYRQDPGAMPVPITPDPGAPKALRFADARLTADGQWLVCVMEDHRGGGEPKNGIALVATSGMAEPRWLVSGHDFCAAPRLSPDGKRLSWLSWDHPAMPWDGTELYVATFDPSAALSQVTRVAGGPEESIVQPAWSPDGVLHYLSDRTGYWNLYADRAGQAVALTREQADFGVPMWGLGVSRYTFLNHGRIAAVYTKDGSDTMCVVAPGAQPALTVLDTPFTSMSELHAFSPAQAGPARLAFLGASATAEPAVIVADLDAGRHEVIKRSSELAMDIGYLSQPKPIAFPSSHGQTAYALFYAPKNQDFAAPDGERPPLIVISHGGPTAHSTAVLRWSVQFWTSRGFAVVDVNYSGSSGYGRAYRERLKGNWGVLDTADCIAAAKYLAERGDVDGTRMAIRGGSAGGYTTLCALVFHNVFAAGASYYGVADLETLARDTHKFESRYLDSLIGPYPAEKARYIERSPVHYVGKLSCPLILFQGLEDKVVPPSQAEIMIEALAQKGLPWAYVPFAGEQHGFRKAESIERAFDAELYFYSRVFGFAPAGNIQPVDIANLPL